MRKTQYAGAIIMSANGQLALQKRDNKPWISNPGLVSIFGGSVENGEAIEEALSRELREELQLDLLLEPYRFLGYQELFREEQQKVVEAHCYLVELRPCTRIQNCSEGELVWFDPAERGGEHVEFSPYCKDMLVRFSLLRLLSIQSGNDLLDLLPF